MGCNNFVWVYDIFIFIFLWIDDKQLSSLCSMHDIKNLKDPLLKGESLALRFILNKCIENGHRRCC